MKHSWGKQSEINRVNPWDRNESKKITWLVTPLFPYLPLVERERAVWRWGRRLIFVSMKQRNFTWNCRVFVCFPEYSTSTPCNCPLCPSLSVRRRVGGRGEGEGGRERGCFVTKWIITFRFCETHLLLLSFLSSILPWPLSKLTQSAFNLSSD